ncbi:DCL family protein [Providencia alcalifaciens]|uniref:PF11523 family protein n=1 Tax=Providencia alcalifaciens 205/92 TaxID=1256988 RepID=A0AAV3M5T7_9GAMM|nr:MULTISPECIES: DCL family protein [Providencia]EUD11014.1 PF11523 family protein [Providencia alcalifaciens 205/92]MCL0002420.1 DCL family protein [Providencia rettgeri]MTC64668.1 DUF3223 domain-containing protein [Providencia alcalifaciens]WGZ53592.1 DCL family protein [Providencia alcalifaciens]
MAKPIIFGDYQFKTKKSAIEEIRRRISLYQFGQKLTEEDEIFFSELFKLHSEYEEKIGCGIASITVEKDFHNNKCLYIHRQDGKSTDISWVHCVKPASQKTIVSYAFRRAVKEAIVAFKKDNLKETVYCPILHIPLNFENSHVAYITPSFDQLFLSFLELVEQNIDSIELKNPNSDDYDQRGVISDSRLKEKWVQYHQENAQLKLLSAKANLSRKS